MTTPPPVKYKVVFQASVLLSQQTEKGTGEGSGVGKLPPPPHCLKKNPFSPRSGRRLQAGDKNKLHTQTPSHCWNLGMCPEEGSWFWGRCSLHMAYQNTHGKSTCADVRTLQSCSGKSRHTEIKMETGIRTTSLWSIQYHTQKHTHTHI